MKQSVDSTSVSNIYLFYYLAVCPFMEWIFFFFLAARMKPHLNFASILENALQHFSISSLTHPYCGDQDAAAAMIDDRSDDDEEDAEEGGSDGEQAVAVKNKESQEQSDRMNDFKNYVKTIGSVQSLSLSCVNALISLFFWFPLQFQLLLVCFRQSQVELSMDDEVPNSNSSIATGHDNNNPIPIVTEVAVVIVDDSDETPIEPQSSNSDMPPPSIRRVSGSVVPAEVNDAHMAPYCCKIMVAKFYFILFYFILFY
jgi:hypothetical protein